MRSSKHQVYRGAQSGTSLDNVWFGIRSQVCTDGTRDSAHGSATGRRGEVERKHLHSLRHRKERFCAFAQVEDVGVVRR